MHQIGAVEAKNRLSELLRLVEAGEEIAITRRGRVVARLVPPQPASRGDEALAAVARIRARRRGTTLGGISVKEPIDQGRR